MRQYIQSILAESGTLNFQDILLQILASAVIGLAIYVSYWYTHAGTAYSKKFNVTLISLTVLTATVMTVIGNNIALSLGMVGALSIVRFRTAIKDSRDTTYIFWAIIVGICCGVGDYLVAGVGTGVVFLILLVLGRVRNENRILLIVRGKQDKAMDMEGVIFATFQGRALQKVKNTTMETVELIYEIDRKTYTKAYKQQKDVIQALYQLGGIEYANIITQSDEITG